MGINKDRHARIIIMRPEITLHLEAGYIFADCSRQPDSSCRSAADHTCYVTYRLPHEIRRAQWYDLCRMARPQFMPTTKSLNRELAGLLLHVLLATAGVYIIFVALGASMASVWPGIRDVSFGGELYYLLVVLPSVFLGLFVNRIMRHRSASWVGAVASLFLLSILLSDVAMMKGSEYYQQLPQGHYWSYEFKQLFSPFDARCGDSECLKKLFVTFPFLSSLGYSFGAWVALRSSCGGSKD